MRNKFDMQLELLNEQLTHMGELCEVAIDKGNRGTERRRFRTGSRKSSMRMKRLIRWKKILRDCA